MIENVRPWRLRRGKLSALLIAFAPAVAFAEPATGNGRFDAYARQMRPDDAVADETHLLALPAFSPSSLVATYHVFRIGAALRMGAYSPLPLATNADHSDDLRQVVPTGSWEFSHRLGRAAVLFSLEGSGELGTNVSSIVGRRDDFELRPCAGVVLAIAGGPASTYRLSLRGTAGLAVGTEFTARRAINGISTNPQSTNVKDLAAQIGPTLDSVVQSFTARVFTLDLPWAHVWSKAWSLQGNVGISFENRIYQPRVVQSEDIVVALPKLGLAVQYWPSDWLLPVALLFEYRVTSGSRQSFLVAEKSPRIARWSENIFAVGLHWVDVRTPNLLAAVTVFARIGQEREPTYAAEGANASLGARDIGLQMMGGFVW